MKRFLVLAALLIVAPLGAQAHNHLANPSGVTNQSGDGLSPGKSGETNLNPGGNDVGRANADKARGDERCGNCAGNPGGASSAASDAGGDRGRGGGGERGGNRSR